MKILKHFLLVILLSFSSISIGQQLPQFTQYMYNTISINPAYAGSRDVLSMVALHRSQWMGIEGAPSTQTISIHAPMRNERVGLGLSFINDKLGYERFSYIYGDFSYTIPTSDYTNLAFGLKAGFTHYNLDTKLLSDPSIIQDPFFDNELTRWSPNIGVGIFWYGQKWYAGLSAPRILSTDYNEGLQVGDGNLDYAAIERVSYYFTGGYVFDLSDSMKFKPATLFKLTNGAPVSIDLTANFLFNDRFWIGGSYRINESAAAFGGLIDFQVTDRMRVGYTYEIPTSDIRGHSNGTHEVLLMYEIIRDNRERSPRYF